MKSTVTVPQKELESFVINVLSAVGVSKEHGIDVAARLIKAHLRGFDTHGLPCLPGYIDALQEGRINAKPELKVKSSRAWAKQLDADNGLGQVAGVKAMRLCLEAAEEFGIGSVAVKRSNHFGAASTYSLMALEQDCIGIVMANASAVTAPFGAAEALLGTNPLSVAIPTGEQAPFVIDMATSEGSRKKVRKALEDGQTIPAGWALDKNGDPTVDPAAALEGVMLPFGGMKGSAITILIDILSGVLSGAKFGGEVLSVATNQEQESGNGNLMLAIKIDSFMPVAEFKTRMDVELTRIRALQPAQGFESVLYPGFLENTVEQVRLEQGIPLDNKLIEKMQQLGDRVQVKFPASL